MSDTLRPAEDRELDQVTGGALFFGRNETAFDPVTGQKYKVTDETRARAEYMKLARQMSSEDAIRQLIAEGYLV